MIKDEVYFAMEITMNFEDSRTFQAVFDEFITSKKAQGVADATLNNYKYHLRSISKYLNIEILFRERNTINEILNSETENKHL